VVVDPTTPLVEVVGTALVRDGPNCPDFEFVVHWNVNEVHLTSIGVLVSESDVAPGSADWDVPEIGQDGNDLTSRKRRPDH